MEIKFTEHALERAIKRGTSEDEVAEVLIKGIELQAKAGRKSKELVFDYNSEWLGNFYSQKKVVVIYVEEYGEIVVITVKVYYEKWGG